MIGLGAIISVSVRVAMGSGGFVACTLGYVAWDTSYLGSVLVGLGSLVDIVWGGYGAGVGVLFKRFFTLGSVAGESGMCLRTRCVYFQYLGNFNVNIVEGGSIGESMERILSFV